MKSLLKAIDTIDAVAEAGSAGIRELSTITGYPPSTIHRIAATLVERHYFPTGPGHQTICALIPLPGTGYPGTAKNPSDLHRTASYRTAHG